MQIKRVGAFEAKTHLPSLLKQVQAGDSIIITNKGLPVAILSPYIPEKQQSVQDIIKSIRTLRSTIHLKGLSIRDMREEGRR